MNLYFKFLNSHQNGHSKQPDHPTGQAVFSILAAREAQGPGVGRFVANAV